MASGGNTPNRSVPGSFNELLRFLRRTLWTLILLVFGLTVLVSGYFISNPKLAGIAGAFGIGMTVIAVSIYVVFAGLRYTGR